MDAVLELAAALTAGDLGDSHSIEVHGSGALSR
jgi:hypothetical protein